MASVVGMVVVVGSIGLYIPMIARLARKRCAVGLSVSTWYLKIAGYSMAWLYRLPYSLLFVLVPLHHVHLMLVLHTSLLLRGCCRRLIMRHVFAQRNQPLSAGQLFGEHYHEC